MKALILLLAAVVLACGCIGLPAAEDAAENVTAEEPAAPVVAAAPTVDEELADCAEKSEFINFQECIADVANRTASSNSLRASGICSSIIDDDIRDSCANTVAFPLAQDHPNTALTACEAVTNNDTRVCCLNSTLVAIADYNPEWALELADEYDMSEYNVTDSDFGDYEELDYNMSEKFYYDAGISVSSPVWGLEFCGLIEDSEILADDCYLKFAAEYSRKSRFDMALTACIEIENSTLQKDCTINAATQATVIHPSTAWTYCNVLEGASQKAECFATVAPAVALYDHNISLQLCAYANASSIYWNHLCYSNIAGVIALSDLDYAVRVCHRIAGGPSEDDCYWKTAAFLSAAGDMVSAAAVCNEIGDEDKKASCYSEFYS